MRGTIFRLTPTSVLGHLLSPNPEEVLQGILNKGQVSLNIVLHLNE